MEHKLRFVLLIYTFSLFMLVFIQISDPVKQLGTILGSKSTNAEFLNATFRVDTVTPRDNGLWQPTNQGSRVNNGMTATRKWKQSKHDSKANVTAKQT
jgi:hypothetical protein